MAETMTMNRVIHQAVRRDLARLEAALATAGDGEMARARQLERPYANLHRELTRHHEGEDQFIFHFLAKAGLPSDLLAAMDDEHHAMTDALGQTRAAMASYASSGSATDAQTARDSVARTRAVVDQHLDHEERDLEPLLEPHMKTAEWKAVEKQLRRASPVVIGTFFAWIQDGMTEEGRSYLRSTVPPPVTAVFGRFVGWGYHRDISPTWRT